MSIEALAFECRTLAAKVSVRHKKHASFQLYRVLTKCMELCEACNYSRPALVELEKLVLTETKTKSGRKYVERNSDAYVLVCRFVFPNDRNNASRYAMALREASKLQINSQTLYDWLAANGGVNALYMRRPLEATYVSTRCIHLTESVTLPKSEPFTLTLQRTLENTYRVIA